MAPCVSGILVPQSKLDFSLHGGNTGNSHLVKLEEFSSQSSGESGLQSEPEIVGDLRVTTQELERHTIEQELIVARAQYENERKRLEQNRTRKMNKFMKIVSRSQEREVEPKDENQSGSSDGSVLEDENLGRRGLRKGGGGWGLSPTRQG